MVLRYKLAEHDDECQNILFINILIMPRRSLSIFNPRSIFSDDFMDSVFDLPVVSNMVDRHKMEMYEESDSIVVKIEAPGFDEGDFDISFEDNMLTVTGNSQKQNEEKDEAKKYYYREISNDSFTRSVNMPVRVKADSADAEFTKGVLKITVPKAEESKPKRIVVKGK